MAFFFSNHKSNRRKKNQKSKVNQGRVLCLQTNNRNEKSKLKINKKNTYKIQNEH